MRAKAAHRSDLVTLQVDLLETRERAIFVRDHDTGLRLWLPLAHAEVSPSDSGRHHEVELPIWLAKEKGLI